MKSLLYIEDDDIDILLLRRLIKPLHTINLDIVGTFQNLRQLDLSNYDLILSDSNLPDADYATLMQYLQNTNVQFVSGIGEPEQNVWAKPIDLKLLLNRLYRDAEPQLNYIEELADGDMNFKREMITTALEILPERKSSLQKTNLKGSDLKKVAHKTISSFRVCGMDTSVLSMLETEAVKPSANDELIKNLIALVVHQIDTGIKMLKAALNAS